MPPRPPPLGALEGAEEAAVAVTEEAEEEGEATEEADGEGETEVAVVEGK